METEQVAVRLPKAWVTQFRKGSQSVSAEIQDRLWRSILADRREPHFEKLSAQIDQLAKSVHRAFGAEWHADHRAFEAFVETIRRLLADLPRPTARLSKIQAKPADAGELIYNNFVSTTQELENGGVTSLKPTVRQLLESGDE